MSPVRPVPPHYLFEDERKLWTEAAAVSKKNWQVGTAGGANVVSYDGDDIGPVATVQDSRNRDHIVASHPAAVMTLLERLSALREKHALAVGYGLPPNAVPDFTQLEILLCEEKARCNDARIDYDKADTVAVVKKWLAQYAAAPSVEATKTEALDKLEERFQNIARAQATTHSDYVSSMATLRAELLLRLTQRDEEIRILQEERTQLDEQHTAAIKELRDEIEAHALELGRVRELRDNAYRDVQTQQEVVERLNGALGTLCGAAGFSAPLGLALKMKNLAGNPHSNETIRRELERVGLEVIVRPVPITGEVYQTITGKLPGFELQRLWYYWSVSGKVPLAVAQELYKHPVGKTDIRVAGHCGCPPPEEWTRWLLEDGRERISRLEYDKCVAMSTKLNWPDVAKTYVPDDVPAAAGAKPYVTSYHIDSELGLYIFVETIKARVIGEQVIT